MRELTNHVLITLCGENNIEEEVIVKITTSETNLVFVWRCSKGLSKKREREREIREQVYIQSVCVFEFSIPLLEPSSVKL